MSFQRARSEDQIQDRIQEIVNAASIIYDSVGYEGLSFSTISEYTKFTRPNIYKYFKTKEEILLLIMIKDFKSWISRLSKSFKINKLYSIYKIGEIWTDTLIEHERLIELYAILFTTIEKNVSVEALAEFEKECMVINSTILDLVSQLFPNASNDSLMNFMYSVFTLAFGLYPMCKLSDLQLEAINLAGSNYIAPDFKKTYMASLYQLMYCLEHSIEIKKD
ncbi:TetR/AcrR family transcriptional regulator [Clostridium estertheticum]|uniref:TetR/AcrR family transcriptional regulator n=1 Tax=Clostridium estertheticum TaxID=238834 RepID=A0AA47ENR8_9CLOT|nr:TetR/AcrR family transcriptional regulator [Clostridium estertheticum]MBU3155780.1 TetR/AcrR family transcriptional regulator [Clostridium estertheticum]MBU3201463.1 TetR/AcrR family transcriptional regulator [Clostridium estertheticum]WAG62406.1 TetR/AcrR family transcriptional regulator [Clostridium estertheticum]WAG63484.1 TetR/AcrR family transcriptional regulator [Clostridium estertheticum]